MKIAIASDTHGLLRASLLQEIQTCDFLLYAGDFDNEKTYHRIKELPIPKYLIRGNCDYGSWVSYLPGSLLFRLDQSMFYLIHDLNTAPLTMPESDFVIFGHTHQYADYESRGVRYLNPGSASHGRGAFPTASMMILEHMPGTGEWNAQKLLLS